MPPTKVVTVSFDETTHAFTYTEMEMTVAGPRLLVPPNSEAPVTIIFSRASDEIWCFRAIGFIGSVISNSALFNSWRFVTATEVAERPVVIYDAALLKLVVAAIEDAQIVIENTNPPKSLNLGYSFQLVIEDSKGQRWGTADPQVINEKEDG